jgi:hypothetical protein
MREVTATPMLRPEPAVAQDHFHAELAGLVADRGVDGKPWWLT